MELVEFQASPACEPLFTVNPLDEEGLSGMFVTHPPVAERVERLRALDPGWRERDARRRAHHARGVRSSTTCTCASRDLEASRRFYVAVAEALEFGPIKAGDGWFELGELFVSADGPVTTNLHFAFKAPDRSVGRALPRGRARRPAAATTARPGTGRATTAGYYSAYVFDPDGNNVEAVVHGDVERSAPSVVFRWNDKGRLSAAF